MEHDKVNDMEPSTPVPREDAKKSEDGHQVLLGDEDIADDEIDSMEDINEHD